jgi:WD40 repeat protein
MGVHVDAPLIQGYESSGKEIAMANIGCEALIRRAKTPLPILFALSLAISSPAHTQAHAGFSESTTHDTAQTATDQDATPATTPAPVNSATPSKARKAAKKKEEPEEEWVLLPEPVKNPAAPPSAPASSATDAAAPSGGASPLTTPEPASNAALAQSPAATPATPVATAANPTTEQRLALVIGNSNYKTGRLPNSENDARSMSALMQQLGWQVIELENVGREEMKKAAEDFGNRLASGNGVGLFYYAGHGIQSGNTNYLVPIDADIQDEDELPAHAYDSSDLLHRMDRAKNKLNIVILDACRNNPFANRFATVTRGLASVQPGSETPMIISYATMAGATAADGTGGNGLYTAELLRAMSQSGLGVEEVFKSVRAEVKKKSGAKQIPYENSSLTSDFYFNPTPEQAAQQPMLASNAVVQPAGQPRSLLPVLLSRKLFENYQLAVNLPLPAAKVVSGFYADDSSFFTVTEDRRLRVWDVLSGAVTQTQPDFGTATLSSNHRFVLGQSDAHTLHVLDTAARGAQIKTYQVPGEIENFGLSPDARRLLVYTKERGFSLLDTASSAVIGEARKVDGAAQFAFAPVGNRVILWGSQSGELHFFDTESGKRISHGSQHQSIGLARFSEDGSLLLTAADNDTTVLWQLSSGKQLRKLDLESAAPLPQQAEFIDGGKRVILNLARTAGKAGPPGYMLGVWDTATGQRSGEFAINVLLKNMTLSPDKTQLFATGPDRSTRVFDVASRSQIEALHGAELIGFSPDGRRLIAQDGDGIRIYETHGFTPIARFPGQLTAFLAPTAAKLYATAASDGSVRLVDFETGDTLSVLKGHIDPVTTVNFAPDGKQLVTISDDKVARLWALPSVKDVNQLAKDKFESTTEYQKRVAGWSSDYTSLVMLGDYNADTESYAAKIGEFTVAVPMPRDEARRFAGQREAILTGKLKMYDAEQLQLADVKLARVP